MAEAAKVLVIDDDTDFVEYVRAVLEHEGHRVFVATEGPAGVEAARREQPTVILVDLVMAPKDGFTICDELRSFPETRGSAILVVSAIHAKLHKTFGSLDVGARLDADGFLEKPFDQESLVERVGAMVRLARSRTRNTEEGR